MTRAVSFALLLASAALQGRSGGADAAPVAAELVQGVGR